MDKISVMTEQQYAEWSDKERRYGFSDVVITPDLLSQLMKGLLIHVDVHEEFEVTVRFSLEDKSDE